MQTLKITLVGCCREKLPQAAAAADLYRSPLFRKAKAYAEQLGAPWRILSAAYGVLGPSAVIEPYDLTLASMGFDGRRAWDRRVVSQLDSLLAIHAVDRLEVVLLAGQSYAGWIPAVSSWCTVHEPMKGLQVGQRLSWLNAQLAEAA